ncbi:ISL3 family transposase [Mycobacterium sp. SM1]|uniref:ISL3 family transposase n=1 Tax=Mycobacterium sp. SM1 TaxID=2816243 RepID=UPI001BCAA952|nr:ISL3 family transposase [Mycobacterium sp. SM1]MBS4729271.1 ISL3 family transposase [Mycobacterium sp. SM1]
MRNVRLWRALLGVDRRTVIEDIEFGEDAGDGEVVVAHVRARGGARGPGRCGRCGRKSSWYDRGEGRRRWRGLDWGTVRVFLEADAPRVNCAEHGPTVVAVPWARHAAGHTYAFDDTVAWLAVACSKTAVCELMRVAWRTVGAIVARVWADTEKTADRFANLRRIGIDEISYKRHHKYLTVVVDHDTGHLIWAAPGRDTATLRRFFDALGAERAAQITHVSADAADWIADVVAERCPNAIRCADPFHVVAWATEALDAERRRAWNDARALARSEPKRRRGRPATDAPPRPGHERARQLKGARYALWKNPEDLTERQTAKLAWIAKTDTPLYRAYLLKEGLRHVFSVKGEDGKQALDRWISWARRCRIPVFIELARRIIRHRQAIDAALDHGLSQGLIESTNTKIRVLTRIAFGFHNPAALIALAMLALGGHRPTLPGRG